MNTYTWQFTTLEVFPSFQGFLNVVHTVHWKLTGSDGGSHQATAYGTQRLGPVNAQDFTAFAQLTSAKVQGWVEALMGNQELADQRTWLDQKIANLISPASIAVAPPWG